MSAGARDTWRRVVACLLALAMAAGMAPAAPVREALAEEGAGIEEVPPEGGDAVAEDVSEEVPTVADAGDGARSSADSRGDGIVSAEEGREVVADEGAPLEETAEACLAVEGEAEERVGAGEAPEGKEAGDASGDIVLGAQAVSVSDPRVVADSSMRAGQVATWDCVWLGSYPQTEVTSSDAEYASLEAASWDSKGDATVGGQRYRRISRSDATLSDYWPDDGYGSATYRYFRWEPVKWRVLEANGTSALVVADVALDDRPYNTNDTSVTWEASSVRSWLNGYGAGSNEPGTDFSSRNFFDAAFGSAQRSAVLQTAVANADSQSYGTDGGSDTSDRVFLLAESDVWGPAAARHGFVSDYDTWDEARICKTSDYAHAMGAWRFSSSGYEGNCRWWLRSPGYSQYYAARVGSDGSVDRDGYDVDYDYDAVRPALNLNLTSSAVSSAGTVSSDGSADEQAAPDQGGDLIDGWVALPGGAKGYARGGALVTGWMDLGSSKYWFHPNGVMATGWTDVEVNGKLMHYYFNPASGNLARGIWMTIGGRKYYFRPSGNMATGFADIDDNGTTKKYYFDEGGQMLTGWQEIEVNGKQMRYYFRPAGSMAVGWADIDGTKYYFRASGNMATGWADVSGSKFYFDAQGRMQTGWQDIGGKRYYFRASGAMQTGRATIDGKAYTFSASGVLVS